MQVLHVAGVAILDDAARDAAEEAAAAASRQAEQAAEGGDDAGPRLSRKEEKRQRRAERAAKLAQAARNGLPNGVSGELQARTECCKTRMQLCTSSDLSWPPASSTYASAAFRAHVVVFCTLYHCQDHMVNRSKCVTLSR